MNYQPFDLELFTDCKQLLHIADNNTNKLTMQYLHDLGFVWDSGRPLVNDDRTPFYEQSSGVVFFAHKPNALLRTVEGCVYNDIGNISIISDEIHDYDITFDEILALF